MNNSEILRQFCAETFKNNEDRKSDFSELLLPKNAKGSRTLYQ